MNGEEDEAAKAVEQLKKRIESQEKDQASSIESEIANSIEDESEVINEETKEMKKAEEEKVADEADIDSSEEVARPKKGRTKNHKKKN